MGEASLKSVLSWLAELPFASDDGNKFLIVRLSLSEYLENNSSSIADVIIMGRGTKSGFLREREISNGKIDLFQGKSTSRGGYKGDRAVHFADRVTLQLHPLQVYKEGSSSRRQTWAVAVYFPKNIQRIAENFLVEV